MTPEYLTMTITDLANESLRVQNACNLSGIVHSYARALSDLRTLCPSLSTDAINRHPIAVVWADKVAHLAGIQHPGNSRVSRAYDAVYKIIADGAHSEVARLERDQFSRFETEATIP
jgi:hypothetical protein